MAIGTTETASAAAPDPAGGGPGGGDRRPSWPFALALLPVGLFLLASWYGRHVRPSADEWCFLPHVRDEGVLGLIDKFWTLDNGRLGNGLLVGLYAEFPVAGHQWYGPVSVAVMLLLLWGVTAALLRRAVVTVPRGVPLLVAGMVATVFLFATPNTYKTFYWPAASVSHTLAPVLCVAAAIPLLRGRGRRGRITALAVAAGAGVFMGTLSEEASVVSLVVLGGVVLFAPLLLAERVRRTARIWAVTGGVGILVGTLILYTSPGSRNRRERFDAERMSMLSPEALGGSLRGFLEILAITVTNWQYVGAVAAGVLLGLLARGGSGAGGGVLLPLRARVVLPLMAAAFLVSGYLCTVITYPVFQERVVTTERTWNDYLLVWVVLLVAAGGFLGRWLRGRGSAVVPAALAGAALACVASVVGVAVPLVDLADRMEVRAERWDRQDAHLRAAAARGETVMPYTPTKVGKMLEPFSQNGKRKWPAQCVADYYDLEKVVYAPEPRW
ncbi:DUF6056 family protein [Streptomyces yaizuensis]|uniref:DUF6056 family protein n=1 Tax=Streptomyces yaizuensis TaxID=2989713 RepID=A0ABQ5P3Q5_9ACTN|nr:DUF6056 family protein [Streptomyces sp. YSPA8]GLF97228.1 DUF6056 family protein [Streptomyces sp. YSPA8]